MAKKKKTVTPGLFDAPKTAEQIKMENAQDLYNFLFQAIASGTKMPRMPLSELRKFKCSLPPIDERMKFVAIAEQTDKSKFVCLSMSMLVDKKSLINNKKERQ